MRALPFTTHPLVLAPMAGACTPELVAAVSETGAFAFLPCAYLAPSAITELIAAVRTLTSRPFGVNLFVEPDEAPVADALRVQHAHDRLRPYRERLGILHAATPAIPPHHFHAQLDAVLAAQPAAFGFTFGIPTPDVLARFRTAGIPTLGTATTVAEAVALERAGLDAVCAQGAEAGAHRGTFLAPVSESLVGTLALVPQVVDAVRVPVIATGGIGDGRGVAAVMALGASAAQVGSAFLLANESAIPAAYKRVLQSPRVHDTTVTTAFSGRSARGVRNAFIAEVGAMDQAPYPFQNALTRDVRTAAAKAGDAELLSLWAGQAASLARGGPASEIVARLMVEAREAAGNSWERFGG